MWQKYFGPLSKIVAIDITPSCSNHEIPGTVIRIGDQSDEKFLQELVDEKLELLQQEGTSNNPSEDPQLTIDLSWSNDESTTLKVPK